MSNGGSGSETGLKGSEGGYAAYLQTGFKFMVALGPVFGSGPGLLSLVKERQKVGCSSRARLFYDAINCLAE